MSFVMAQFFQAHADVPPAEGGPGGAGGQREAPCPSPEQEDDAELHLEEYVVVAVCLAQAW